MGLSLRASIALAPFALAGCPADEPLGRACTVSADCPVGQLCVDEVCVEDPATLPVGEGEGEGDPGEGEGEGDPGEGEGEGDPGEGEGEGDPGEGEGEGEGEGDPGEGEGEGEGEGDPGEGEGEGEGEPPPPTCTPACGDLQSCTATDVCTNDGGAALCDNFGGTTIDFFADQNLNVNGTSGDRFVYDGKDRWYVNRLTNMRQGMLVEVAVIAGYDTVAYVLDDSTQQCTELARVDQSFDDERFQINFAAGATPPYSGGSAVPLDVVVTSYAAINGGTDGGAFTLQTRGILCTDGNAAGDVTDSQTTYDQCFRALFERTTSLSCAASNPCARDANDLVTGKYCALQTSSGHVTGTPIILRDDPVCQ